MKTVGNGSLTNTAPTTGATKGIAILSDRANTATLTYRGNGAGIYDAVLPTTTEMRLAEESGTVPHTAR